VPYKRRISVNRPLPVFLLASTSPHSSEVQHRIRFTAILGRHQQTHQAAPLDREQGRAGSSHPEAHLVPSACPNGAETGDIEA
jgi:hypothetical protein